MRDLDFDAATHTYTLEGRAIPNVTRVLEPLEHFDKVPPSILEYASERGTAVHRATELYDTGELDEASLDDELVPYLEGWKKFLDESGFQILRIERRVYHERYRYAGTLDRQGILGDDPWIIDIKTVSQLSPVTGLQTAAYADPAHEDKRTKAPRRGAVQLRPDGTYRLKEYREQTDFAVFLAALNLYNWRNRNGRPHC